ncbi:uroporphyrin-III C-methyltransferase domain protein [Burkholderia thailandensis]|nr:uroporphyrin-III C-methyltransferase domain protein [Burkholderia thailandensis]
MARAAPEPTRRRGAQGGAASQVRHAHAIGGPIARRGLGRRAHDARLRRRRPRATRRVQAAAPLPRAGDRRWPGYCSTHDVIGNGAGGASQDYFRTARQRTVHLDNGVPRVRPPRRPDAQDAVLFWRSAFAANAPRAR